MDNNCLRKIALVFMLLALPAYIGCSKASDKAKGDKAAGPAAKATQSVETPVLKSMVKEEEPAAAAAPPPEEPPKGPITLPPAEEPKAEEGKLEKPGAEGVPLARIGEETVATPRPTGEVQAMAAPTVVPEEGAKSPEAQQIPYEPKIVTANTNIDIIVDASGSMEAPFAATSQSKFDLLRSSLSDVIYELTQQQMDFPRNIAIRAFGAKSPSADNNCQDTNLIAPMGEPNLTEIKKLLDETKPMGKSPISQALAKAAEDFPPGGTSDRVVVLIADGVDNCEEDPCEAVRKMEAGGYKHTVHVVAFDVNSTDQASLECIANASGGKFFAARNGNELLASLGEAINSTVPYNIKLSARAGATPLPFNLTIFKAGTQQVVKKETSLGTKLITLKPDTYDFLIEYGSSPQTKKPTKVLKGVEILETTRVEQTVNFDLGQITLSAINNEGKLVPARFEITPASGKAAAEGASSVEIDAEAKSFFLTPAVYNISADLMEVAPEGFSLLEKNVEIKTGETVDKAFRFQKGTLAMKGITTQNEEIPFLFQAYKSGSDKVPVANGAFVRGGGSVALAPGTYDIIAMGTDPNLIASPRTKVKNVEVKAAQKNDLTIKFEMGTLKIGAVDGKNNKIPAEFILRDHDTGIRMTSIKSESGDPVSTPVPPGSYDIVAVSLKSNLEPKPSVPIPTITVTANKPLEQTVKFILGTLRLRGRNAKEQPISTEFTIYKSGMDEIVTKAPVSTDWMVFDLAPGIYDAFAVDTSVTKDPKPMIWLRDLKVEDGKSSSHEAIYTAGKIKIIGRSSNNRIIQCKFKVFRYGADRELISGVTGDDWEVFEIDPGKYYLEASYVDDVQTVTLKKWINISIGENEVVEQVLRF